MGTVKGSINKILTGRGQPLQIQRTQAQIKKDSALSVTQRFRANVERIRNSKTHTPSVSSSIPRKSALVRPIGRSNAVQRVPNAPINGPIQNLTQVMAGEKMGLIDSIGNFAKSQGGRQVLAGLAGGLQGITAQTSAGLKSANNAQRAALGLPRRKTMNPTNFRALRKAATRLNSYKRFSKRIDKTLAKLAK